MEALTTVQKPRLSQTLPIKKTDGAAFWEREDAMAMGFQAKESDGSSSDGGSEAESDVENNLRKRSSKSSGRGMRRRTAVVSTGDDEDGGERKSVGSRDDVSSYHSDNGQQDGDDYDPDGMGSSPNLGDVSIGVRESGRPPSRASRWREQFGEGLDMLRKSVPSLKIPLGKLVPWRDDEDDEGRHQGGWSDDDSEDSEDSQGNKRASKPPFKGADRLWFWDDAWNELTTRQKTSRICCCDRCFPVTPPYWAGVLQRYDERAVRKAKSQELWEKNWRVRGVLLHPYARGWCHDP